MNEAKQILDYIIDDFSIVKFTLFFRRKTQGKYLEINQSYQKFDDNDFKNGIKLGEAEFDDGQLLVCAFEVQKNLSERSGKKAQYDKAKGILKSLENQIYSAGIFIFYDHSGNFRFSLVYPESIGTRREWNHFRRFTYFVSREFTNKTFLHRIGEGDFSTLAKIKEVFSVEKVTKEFYQDIANWYFWAVSECQFPKDAEEEENGRNIAVIRLITRMIFVWFMRERGLINKELFEKQQITNILKNLNNDESSYYTAILQNLFFATLSTKKEERHFGSEIKGQKGYNPDFGNQYVFRYQEMFKYPENIKNYFGDIPFLNGGLFECLDDKPNNIIIDGFTRIKKNQPKVPNFLFFGAEQNFDLSDYLGPQTKKSKVRGLIDILSSFNFTIDENTPDDADIALDPELLGRVFENLLASFNPETSTTARKTTGSYYTPREIVNYMVSESLKAYFKTHLNEIENIDEKLEQIFSNESSENPFDDEQSKKLVELIESVKIVDPAVGSGAFPMGILNKLVFILNKIDPGNKLWEKAQLKAADAIPDPSARRMVKARIEEFFKGKNADYGRKLYLIQRCIYGVDIQQIAVEIAKLRFFISLLVDEKIDKTKDNWGIEPLPNLDFKIMQGNSLISEFLGIDFDNGGHNQDEEQTGLLFGQDDDSLIKEFEQKKIDFQNEADKDKKATLKQEVEDLMIQIFENKVKKQKGDYFRQLEEIERNYSIFPNQKQREEVIVQEKQKLAQTSNFDLENIEKQFREFTSKKKTRPFFPWKLYFAEVFEKGGFDVVIANPPYIRADDPNMKELRSLIMKSKHFETLWEKWDLYVAFIEKGFKLLKKEGILEYIIPDAYMASKYAQKSHEYFIANAQIKRVNFLNEIKVFEAGVKNLIIEYQNQIYCHNIPLKIKHTPTFSDFIFLPSKKQNELGEFVFRLDDEKKKIGNLQKVLKWGEIFYVSYGLRPSSDERFYKGQFKKDNLISDVLDDKHPKKYIEGKWITKFSIKKIKFLEWGTDRSPSKLVRPTFPELYEPAKIMMGGMTGAIIDKSGLICNHSITVSVLWKDLHGVENRSISGSIKKDFKIKDIAKLRKKLEENSIEFDLKYLLASLNSKLGNFYLSQVRRSQIGFYPDDLKKLPIKKVSITEQIPFITLVDQIMAITKSDDYLQNKEKQAVVKEYEKQIDELVYKLYELTPEEIAIVEGKED